MKLVCIVYTVYFVYPVRRAKNLLMGFAELIEDEMF
jgi:hypothetical protein